MIHFSCKAPDTLDSSAAALAVTDLIMNTQHNDTQHNDTKATQIQRQRKTRTHTHKSHWRGTCQDTQTNKNRIGYTHKHRET